MTLEESATLANNLLRNATEMAEKILDGAAARASKQAKDMADLQAEQTKNTLLHGAQLQTFVGNMNTTMAEERIAAFRLQSAESRCQQERAQQEYARQLAIAEANKPNGLMLLAELAASFAGHYARNAAANYHVMNPPRQPTPTGE